MFLNRTVLLLFLFSWGCAKQPDAQLLDHSDDIFVGEVLKLGPAPRGYSGAFVSYQSVTYRVLRVLKGPSHESELQVFYPIWGDKVIEVNGRAALSPDYFRIGRIFLIFARNEVDKHTGRKRVSVGLFPHSDKAEAWVESKVLEKASQ